MRLPFFSRLQSAKHIGLTLLALLYLLSLLGGFLAPHNHRSQAKETPFLSPTRLHFVDAQGGFHLRPFIYRPRITDRLLFTYDEERTQMYPVRFFVRGEPYHWLGVLESNWHLLGVEGDESAPNLHLLGTDNLGRDVLARLLYAGQISLLVGPLGLLLAYVFGVCLGAVAGYFGGVVDSLLMRIAEIVMSLPTLILILAFRATFPRDISPTQVALLIIVVFAAVGWAEVARLTRNLAFAERGKDYVSAAISLGAGNLRIIARHVLPNIGTPLLTQFALTAPTFILAEVTLSYLGIGIPDPGASWGTMLKDATDLSVLKNYWWMLVPVVCVFLTAFAFQLIGEKAGGSDSFQE